MKKQEIDIYALLYEICEDEAVYRKDTDLIDSGLLDSYAMIELFSLLEDYGIEIPPTRIDRSKLRNAEGIQSLIDEYQSVHGNL